MNRAIFLDRDNTIVKCDADSGDPKQVHLIRGAANAIASLRHLGYRIVVIANEGAVARGIYTEADVDNLHQQIAQKAHESAGAIIDRFYFCPFHPNGTVEAYRRDHPWRKPNPGMILQAARDLEVNLKESWMVGDSERDIEAGHAAGCQTILVETYAHEQESSKANYKVETLAEAAAVIAHHRARTAVGPIAHVVTKKIPMPATGVSEIQSPSISQSELHAEPATTKKTSTSVAESDRDQFSEVTTDKPAAMVQDDSVVETPRDVDHEEVDNGKDDQKAADQSGSMHQVVKDTKERESIHPDPSERKYAEEPVNELHSNELRQMHMPMPAIQTEVESASQTEGRTTRLLMDVLSEIRLWRTSAREFTPFRLFAFVAMALILLGAVAAAIYIGGDRGLAWIGVALVAQLTVIGLLLLLPNG